MYNGSSTAAGKPPRAIFGVYLAEIVRDPPEGDGVRNACGRSKPLPYGGIILFACRGGVPPPAGDQ